MKKRSTLVPVLLTTVALFCNLSVVHAAPIFAEGFSGSTVMSSNPAPPTATTTDYAVLSSKNATGSTLLDLTIPATSSGLAEMQALFTNTPVTLADNETIRLQITFEGTYLMDAASKQFIAFGLYNSGGSYPVPGGILASGLLTDAAHGGTNYPSSSGYAAGWKGFVGRIANPTSGNSAIYTRDPQVGSDNEAQDVVLADGVTGGYDDPRKTTLANGATVSLPDGAYTMILDITKTGLVMQIDQYLYQGAGTEGALLYSLSGSIESYLELYDTFDALAFGYRGFATNAIHLDITSLEIGLVDTTAPSVSGLGDLSVVETHSITLEPVITGAAPLSIQWSSNSVALVGETNATLELNLIQLAQNGTEYSIVVSNAYGSVSDSMTLTVTPAPPPTGLYNIQLNYGNGSSTYTGGARVGSSNDVWNNPVWDGVGTISTNLFSEYIVDSGDANAYGVSATLTALYNDGVAWNSGGTFNHYTSRDDGSPNPVFMERVVKVDSGNSLTLSLSSLPTNAACTIFLYGSGNKHESGFHCSLGSANTNGGISSAYVVYDTNSVYAATGRDVTLATSQGLSWEVLTGRTDPSGDLTIYLAPPGYGNAASQVYPIGVQIQVALPTEGPTEGPVINSISVSGSTVTLSWTDEGVGTYTIQRKTDLTTPDWTDVQPGLPAGLGTADVTASGADQEFYQIKGE